MAVLTGYELVDVIGVAQNNMLSGQDKQISSIHLAYLATASSIVTITNTSGFTLAAATQQANSVWPILLLTGTLGAGANVQSDTAANIIAGMPGGNKVGIVLNQSYRLRIINASSANFAWTLTTNTGVTLVGTMTIAQNTWRDFIVNVATATTVTITSIGTGTYS